jgi:hypothetical protein
VHAAKALPSSWHWKVAGSLAVKLNVAEVEFVGFAGLVPIVVVGAVLSIVTVCFAELSVLPALSIARARTWYVPSAGCAFHVTEYDGPLELVPIRVEGVHDVPRQ